MGVDGFPVNDGLPVNVEVRKAYEDFIGLFADVLYFVEQLGEGNTLLWFKAISNPNP